MGANPVAAGLMVILLASQTPASGALPVALRNHLRDAPFQIVTSIRGLPLGVRDQLQTMFGGPLDIADPGADFRIDGRASDPNLPLRRMIAAGCSRDSYCLIYYERGGAEHTWRVALFHWTPALTRFEWGGTA
jgi:hypothetical protein